STPTDTTYQSTQLTDCPAVPAINSTCFTYIPTRDGTLLSANITFPKTAMPVGGWPVLVDYSGYDPSQPGTVPSEAAVFAYQGYVVVGLNMRGTTCSGGAFDYFEALQSLDGYDAIEVLAHQPWTAHVAANEVSLPPGPDETNLIGKAKIGMVGISYMGISQLFVGQTRPPDLLAITPLSTIADTYRSISDPGGIFNNGFALDWAHERMGSAQPAAHQWVKDRISGGDTKCRDNQMLRLQSVDVVNKTLSNPYYQKLGGDELSPRTFVHNIAVPTYLGGAWQDEQTGGQFSSMYQSFDPTLRAEGKIRAYLTNGVHTESLAAQDIVRLLSFVDLEVGKRTPRLSNLLPLGAPAVLQSTFGGSILKLPPSGFGVYPTNQVGYQAALTNYYRVQKPVHVVWENGAGQVDPLTPTTIAGSPLGTVESDFSTWPPSQTGLTPDMSARRYYLQPDGKLTDSAPTVADDQARGASSYVYDPSTKRASTYDGSTEQIWKAETQTTPDSSPGGIHWKPLSEGNSLSFTTDGFSTTTAMAGQGSVDLWMRSNAADADLEVTITEIRADGQERYIQSGWLRASHRTLDLATSTELAPFQTQTASDAAATAPLNGSGFQPMRIGLFPFAHIFRAGSKLRLNIEAPGGNQPFWKYDTCTLTHTVAGCATVAGTGPQINQVAHSVGRPSSVVLPVLSAAKTPAPPAYVAAATPCPSVRNEPCRPYLPARVATAVAAVVDGRDLHVSWQAPGRGGQPDSYVVTDVATGETTDVAGDVTSLVVPDVAVATPFSFTVAAVYGEEQAPASD
ncbi:MAG TPA: CocE/NonD family hydrolase, partial [Acidimicrobiales bacterium]